MNDNNNYNSFSLWLPINKDFFGFENFDEAPLNILDTIKEDIEKILYKHIKNSISKNNEIHYKHESTTDSSEFIYSRILKFKIYDKTDKSEIGEFKVFSNGLYLWTFNNQISSEDFKNNHLFKLFYVDEIQTILNENNIEALSTKNYKGILNYTQIELLFNGLYDTNIPPSLYFNQNIDEKNEKNIEKINLKNILISILLMHNDSGIKTHSDREKYNCSNDLDNNQDKIYCIYTSSMEQFIRVATTFSLEHYKRGLNFCLKQLSTHGLMRSYIKDDSMKRFLPNSLNSLTTTISSLESYQALIFEKLPLIEYLYKLINGLYETTKKYNLGDTKYLKKLDQAIKQYKRRLDVINIYFENIENSLSIENQKSILKELSDIRKYTEINNEVNINNMSNLYAAVNKENEKNMNKYMVSLAIVTFLITIVSPIVQYIIEKKDNTLISAYNNFDFPSFIFIIIIVIIPSYLLYTTFTKDPTEQENSINSRHIFDNYNPSNITSNEKGLFTQLMEFFEDEGYTNELPSFTEDNKKIACIKLDTLQERFNTYKKYTFSFFSKEEKGIRYVLHIDIHYDIFETQLIKAVYIDDIRVVVINNTKNETLSHEKIHNRSRKIKLDLHTNFQKWLKEQDSKDKESKKSS